MVSRYFFWLDNPPEFFAFDGVFRRSIVFSVAMAVVGALAAEMSGLLGFGTLKNLLIGRYVQPRRERRAFLLIDMKDSTGVAERLGPVRFHELLNDFFHDVADAALECEAEIHKYVGDEAILTWPEAAATDGDCLRFPFLAQEVVERARKTYLSRFGVVPTFRAAIHSGEIVAGEIGDVRREIAYVGDTLNVAARLLEAAKELGRDVLVSDDLLDPGRAAGRAEGRELPTLSVRGRPSRSPCRRWRARSHTSNEAPLPIQMGRCTRLTRADTPTPPHLNGGLPASPNACAF
jgi:adenylate cyclase